MHPILIKIGEFSISTYGFFVFLGAAAAYIFLLNESKLYNISADITADIIFWAMIGGFTAARLFYIILNWQDFLYSPWHYLFSRSGFVFYPGLLGGILAVSVFIKRKKIGLLKTADFIAPAIPLAHSLGRIGCFSYGCCYGKPANCKICMLFPPNSPAGRLGVPVIPTQLISSFFLILIFISLIFIRDHRRFKGQIFFCYLMLYGIFRFIIEFFRGDPRGYLGIFSTSQWFALLIVPIVLVLYWQNSKRRENNGQPNNSGSL